MAVVRPGDHDLTRRGLCLGLLGCATRPPVSGPAWSPKPVPLAPEFARGMNLAHIHRRGRGYGSPTAAAQLDRLAALGVRDVALNPFAYTPSTSSTEIRFDGDDTLTDDDLRAQVEHCHARGLRVMMKPHLWSWQFMTGVGNPDIRPPDWGAWFEAYTRYALHYARIAEETRCAWLCVGLEYTNASRENPGAWARVAEACRKVYAGKLLYAANWYAEPALFADWDAFDAIGIDAYYPLEGTTVEELSASWATHLDAIEAVAKGRPVVFAEAGYRAAEGSTREPWDGDGGRHDPDLQARAYEALLRAATARPWFGGVYWWKWFTDEDGERDLFVPEEAARDVLKAWFP
ncbi:MAG: glycoside hydrolase family 113 [Myxococcota bacterium]